MEKRSDRYTEETKENVSKSRVSKNTILYDEINSKIGYDEIPTYDNNDEINLSSIDMNNLNRGDYQKVKNFKELIDNEDKSEKVENKEEIKPKSYDINKVLEEAKKNREIDELEEKRSLKEEDYNLLNNLNKKYLHQKGFTEEDNEELKELIDTITSKTMVDDIQDEEEKELLSELLATTIDIKLENELSETQIEELAEEKANEEETNTNSFYSKSLELSKDDMIDEKEEQQENDKDSDLKEDEKDYEGSRNIPKIIFISLVLIIIVMVVVYFILQFLGVSFS